MTLLKRISRKNFVNFYLI